MKPDKREQLIPGKDRAFSTILIMVVLMVVGAACIPLLNVQYSPYTGKS
jgi:hypothetical protein